MKQSTIEAILHDSPEAANLSAEDRLNLASTVASLKLAKHYDSDKVVYNFRGHGGSEATLLTFNDTAWGLLIMMDDTHVIELYEAMESGTPLDSFLPMGEIGGWCPECGERVVFETNGFELRARSDCRFEDGVPDIVTELAVPSGRIVFGNDFRDLFEPKEDDYDPEFAGDLCTPAGTAGEALAFGKAGMAHGFCGNTMPGVWLFEDGRIQVATYGDSPAQDNGEAPSDAKRQGIICTDLWWYSLADAEEFKKRGGKLKDHLVERNWEGEFEVKPGVYKVTHKGHKRTTEEGAVVYAELVWDRE